MGVRTFLSAVVNSFEVEFSCLNIVCVAIEFEAKQISFRLSARVPGNLFWLEFIAILQSSYLETLDMLESRRLALPRSVGPSLLELVVNPLYGVIYSQLGPFYYPISI